MADQVDRALADGPGDRDQVRAQLVEVVGRRVVRSGRLELPALVQGDHPVAGGRERFEDGDEVLLGPREAGHQEDGGAGRVARRGGVVDGEGPARGVQPVGLGAAGQPEVGRGAHDRSR
jgi:hypothetical protein